MRFSSRRSHFFILTRRMSWRACVSTFLVLFGLNIISQTPSLANAHHFRDLGSVYFTQRGLEYWTRHLQDSLSAANVVIDRGNFEDYSYESPTAISIRQLDASLGENRGVLTGLRRHLAEWLQGFTLRDPRISIQARGIQYQTQGMDLQVVIDPAASLPLGQNTGLLAQIELTVPKFRFDIDSIRVRDLNNRFLGQFGLNHAFLEYDNPRAPLKIMIGLRISVSPQGNSQVEILRANSNFSRLRVRSGFNRRLILPRVELEVGSQRMVLDDEPIRLAIEQTRAPFVQMMLVRLDRLIQDRVPDLLHNWVVENTSTALNTDVILPPAGRNLTQGPGSGGAPLIYTFGVSSIGVQSVPQGTAPVVRVALNGRWPNLGPDESAARTTISTRSDLRDLPVEAYDIALTLPLALPNALIRDSYYQGAIPAPPAIAGQPRLRFRAPPQIIRPLPGARDRLEVLIPLERDPEGIQESIAFDGPIQIDLVAEVQLKTSGANNDFVSIEIVRYDPLTSQIRIAHQRLDYLLNAQVQSNLRSTIAELNRDLHTTPLQLLRPTNLTESLSPCPVRIKQVVLGSDRLITLYLEYLAGFSR